MLQDNVRFQRKSDYGDFWISEAGLTEKRLKARSLELAGRLGLQLQRFPVSLEEDSSDLLLAKPGRR